MTALNFDILHVDDDEIDRKAIRRALARCGVRCNLMEAEDGLQALDILHERIEEDGQNPVVVLLDINMPRMGGIEFLQHIRSEAENARIRHAVVFVLTTSDARVDVERAYAQNISGYMVKSSYDSGINSLVEFLESYSEVTVFP